ncbi:hypothetical protein, unknown function [Leishmania tarentolae]|uniref:Uncharacterized protein n=1 Tax=Leishmania tarentolae TaxID=5689 RepID=A0A640KZT3_LEITA|nr:hypothetical protein, unknown function [Leishmania tarentolae]
MHPFALLLVSLATGLMLAMPGQSADKCFVTDEAPSVPFGLELCYMHSHNACCLPGNDKDIQTAYEVLVPKGQGCVAGSHRIYTSLYALRQYLCLSCDPNEPSYRFESVKGDIVDGGLVPPSRNSVPGEQTWRICRSFLYGKEGTKKGLWGDNGSRYAECGIIVSSCMSTPVFNITTASFQSPSPSCPASNELIIPSIAFSGSPNPALKMLSMVTQTIPDFQIVIVDDSDPNYDYDKTPCFGRDTTVTVASASLSLWVSAVALTLLLWL